MNFSKFFEKFKEFVTTEDVTRISRRYFVVNGFDGAMTAFGIVLGTLVSGSLKSSFIIYSGLGASLALGLSGFSSAYVSEEAEREREVKKLEAKMLEELEGTEISKKGELASLWISIINGLAPVTTSLIVLSPFLFSILIPIPAIKAAYISISLTFSSLFTLGAYLGKISNRSMIIHGFKMLLVGLLMGAILFFLKK